MRRGAKCFDRLLEPVAEVAPACDHVEDARPHCLRVDPELRPVLGDGQLGSPQRLTARNAVASSFGLRGVDYERVDTSLNES